MIKFESIVLISVGLFFGILLSYYSSFSNQELSNTLSNNQRQHGTSFLLGITLKFQDNETRKQFDILFKPFAAWVMKNELGTISYEVFQSEKDENTIYLLERYATKSDYLDIHRKSNEFLNFRSKLEKLSDRYEMIGNGYTQSNFGFV